MIEDRQLISEALIPAMRAAGQAIMEVRDKDVSLKTDGSPVTQADRAAEEILLEALARHAPSIPVISEENAASHHLPVAPDYFLVDPLDGTKEFIKADHSGAFTVNIGLISQGQPVMGLVYAPVFETLYYGVVGQGAYQYVAGGEKRPLQTSTATQKAEDIVAMASASHRDEATNAWLARHQIGTIKAVGSSLKFCLIAAGQADLYPRFGPTMEWDSAAGDAILRAAGGVTCFEDGTLFHYGKRGYRNGPFFAYRHATLQQQLAALS